MRLGCERWWYSCTSLLLCQVRSGRKDVGRRRRYGMEVVGDAHGGWLRRRRCMKQKCWMERKRPKILCSEGEWLQGERKMERERERETGTRVVGKTQEYGWRRQTHTQAHTDTYTWNTFTHELDGHRARIESSLGLSTSTSISTFTYFRTLALFKF